MTISLDWLRCSKRIHWASLKKDWRSSAVMISL